MNGGNKHNMLCSFQKKPEESFNHSFDTEQLHEQCTLLQAILEEQIIT